jgi:hypothetical protein
MLCEWGCEGVGGCGHVSPWGGGGVLRYEVLLGCCVSAFEWSALPLLLTLPNIIAAAALSTGSMTWRVALRSQTSATAGMRPCSHYTQVTPVMHILLCSRAVAPLFQHFWV